MSTVESTPSTITEPQTGTSIVEWLPNVLNWLPASLKPDWFLPEQHPLLSAFIVVSIFLVLALFARFFIRLVFNRSAIPKEFDNRFIEYVRRPVFTTVLFFGFSLGVKIAQLPFDTGFLVNVFVSIIVASWMRAAFILSSEVLQVFARLHHRLPLVEPRTVPLLDLLNKIIVLLIGSYSLLLIWGINPLGWLASAGIVGLAIGFAAKDTLANLFSGFFILVDSPYKIGDYVNLDSGERGCVTHIGLRSTRLLSRDDIEITLPNAIIANAKIVNESGGIRPQIRVAISVGVAYGTDADKVIDILQTIGEGYADFCLDPAPRVRLRGFGASSLDFELLGWISKPEDRGRIRHELLLIIYKEFRAQSIEIPYTKTDLYIKELPTKD